MLGDLVCVCHFDRRGDRLVWVRRKAVAERVEATDMREGLIWSDWLVYVISTGSMTS